MEVDWLIIFGVIILLCLLYGNIFEGFETTTANPTSEALQNIASVYNNQNMIVTNLNTTGKLTGNEISANTVGVNGIINTNTLDVKENATINGNTIVNGKINTNSPVWGDLIQIKAFGTNSLIEWPAPANGIVIVYASNSNIQFGIKKDGKEILKLYNNGQSSTQVSTIPINKGETFSVSYIVNAEGGISYAYFRQLM